MKLLLHMCCAPCAVYPADVLEKENIEFEGLFYNPNIHPIEEYKKRWETVEKFAGIKDIKVNYVDDFKQYLWSSYTGTSEQRCNMCYSMRMDKVAAFALENGFEEFTTTLLVSPYQNHDLIVELGKKAAEKFGVTFYYRDFRPGFRAGQQGARELGLYRQKYCGCINSKVN